MVLPRWVRWGQWPELWIQWTLSGDDGDLRKLVLAGMAGLPIVAPQSPIASVNGRLKGGNGARGSADIPQTMKTVPEFVQ